VLPHIFIALGVFLIALRLGATDSELFLIGAHATIALPFVILMVGAVVKQLDVSIERAARILGASPARTFFSVLLPTLLPSIVAAAVVAFFISFDELIIALFLMGGNETLPMKLWANMRLDMSPIIAAVASILILVTTAGMFFAEWLRQRANKTLAVVE
jgi:putative spermidine/putrescine transport system permease protein